MDEIMFTPAAVLDFLTQIEELQGYDIGIDDSSNMLRVTIGDSIYNINTRNTTDISVDESVVDDVELVNQSAYDNLSDSGEVELEPINSGLIKQVAKTLLVGGLVRLTAKLLK
jgi:hypothetical protein